MLKAYKYRIYPNIEQQLLLSKTFGCSRYIYNYYLDKKIELYKTAGKSMSKTDCNNHCNNVLKLELPWLTEIDKFALTNSIYHLDAAYHKFFKEHSGFPKFKSKRSHEYSYTTNFTNNNIEINFDSDLIKLPKLKWVPCRLHRRFGGIIKSATVSQVPSGKYFVSILVDEPASEPLAPNNKAVGFDLGIKEFLIDSNGKHILNPKTLYAHEDKLAKLQRQQAKMKKGSKNWNKQRIKQAKMKKGSKNWNKQRIKIARVHEKTANIRKDFLHQLSSQIINENQIIISEDLNIKGMLKNSHLSKAISDVSWSTFLDYVEYKAFWYGRTYHKVSPWYASSQICSECNCVNPKVKALSMREWVCDNCGVVHQRDENAAINILIQGLRELGLLKIA